MLEDWDLLEGAAMHCDSFRAAPASPRAAPASPCAAPAQDASYAQPDIEPVIAAAPDESSEPAPPSPRAAPAQEDVSYVQPDLEPVLAAAPDESFELRACNADSVSAIATTEDPLF